MYSHETAMQHLIQHDKRPYRTDFTEAEHIAKHTKKENTYNPDCSYCTN